MYEFEQFSLTLNSDNTLLYVISLILPRFLLKPDKKYLFNNEFRSVITILKAKPTI